MKQKTTLNSSIFIFGIPLLIIATSILLAKNYGVFGTNSSTMAMAITLDLVLTAPLIYLFLIRKTKISKFTVMPFFVGGLVIASFVIPKSEQFTLELIKTWLLPVVEITVLTLIISKIVKVRKALKQAKTKSNDFLVVLKEAVSEILPPKLASAFTVEFGMIYFAFIAWKKPVYTKNEFTYHKESGVRTLLIAFLMVIFIELVATHLLLHQWSNTAAWIFSILSFYSAIQIFGLIKSIPRTPIRIENDEVLIRMGLLKETRIKVDTIESIEFTSYDYPKEDKSYHQMALFNYNCILHLKEENIVYGLFGFKRQYDKLVLSVDNKEEFKNKLIH